MINNIELSLIIVHYGGTQEVKKCIASISKARKTLKNTEYIFVDNNENPSINPVKNNNWIKYVKTEKNLGWSGGRNFGAKYASGKYYLFLDSDMVIDNKSIKRLLTFIRNNNKIGLVAPKIQNVSGILSPSPTKELTPVRGVFFLSFLDKIFHKSKIIQDYLMSDWNEKKPKRVEVAPLPAFIISKKAFDSIKGFDENLFLYFEESDVSKTLRENGWHIYSLPDVAALHLESKGTGKSSEKVKRIFRKSRFYYFKKHYGIIPAIIVEMFARMSKETLFLAGILILGIFLRFYRFMPNLMYSGEMGTDYMNIWNMLHGTRTWLIGPRTSHEWFFISPIGYWIYAILMYIGNYNPLVINIFWGVIGSLAILVCYFCAKKIFNQKIDLIASFFVAVSPSWIIQTRNSRYNLVSAILFFPYLLLLRDSILDKGKSLFKLGLILGITMSFFPSPLLLVPAILISFIFYKTLPKVKYILLFFLGFIIPNITFLIYEIKDKFNIIIQLLTWVPYRILGFFGLYHKNTVDKEILSGNFYSIYKFIEESFVGYSGTVSVIVFILIVSATVFLIVRNYKNKDKEMGFFLVIISLLVSYIGLFLHGNPPQHYYYVIFPVPTIIAAYGINKILKKTILVILSTMLLGIVSIFGLINTKWFYKDKMPINYEINFVSYDIQQKAVDKIIKDSDNKPLSIVRIGYWDEFENNFANNYVFLLTVKGAKITDNADLEYAIVEGDNNLQKEKYGDLIFSEKQVYVFKN